ncbi:ParA family protein [Myxosarcina sp. GI1]|uniref:ParA family protein n=1 Tax=Myxosarcina sp. GI1 TaxID=1541065 RepID=UPI0012E06092|nr:ParA family protein [Myxosarcina sp. GI1]
MSNTLIAISGDKGGVGKSSLTALLSEWMLYCGRQIKVVDADPNQTTQTWIDKCSEMGRQISSSQANITIVDTAGTSGSSLIKYIRNADLIIVPFKPHIADLEVVIGWFLSVKATLQEKVAFVPNMLSKTKEQAAGVEEARKIVAEEGNGIILPGLVERKAVYPPLLNGSATNFFEGKLDRNTRQETKLLLTEIDKILGLK